MTRKAPVCVPVPSLLILIVTSSRRLSPLMSMICAEISIESASGPVGSVTGNGAIAVMLLMEPEISKLRFWDSSAVLMANDKRSVAGSPITRLLGTLKCAIISETDAAGISTEENDPTNPLRGAPDPVVNGKTERDTTMAALLAAYSKMTLMSLKSPVNSPPNV